MYHLRKNKKHRPMSDINIVPYIDVMLVLLLIFMITTPLLTQGVHVELPKATAKMLPVKQALPIIVSVDHAGHYYLNMAKNPKKILNITTLKKIVYTTIQTDKEHNRARDVYVRADQAVDYGKVVQAMILLQQIGVDNVGLMTQSPYDEKS